MSKGNIILKAENISKQYRLGLINTGTISHDLNRWWSKVRGKEDPFLKIGDTNDRATKGDSQYVWALKDINFEVKQGEVLGIIGKNGAGKSTLLKILSRVTGPTTGSIKSWGRIASLLEVGTGFHPELTGKENVFLNGAILGMTKPEIKAKLEEIVIFSGVARYIDTPVKRYSSGMRVRLAFAVAAFLEPDILVVDEVLAVGDAEFQKKAIGKMQDISRGDGRTVLFVSHNMASVAQLCTKALLINNGMIEKIGGTLEIIDLYKSVNEGDFDKLNYKSDKEENLLIKATISGTSNTFFSGAEIIFNFWLNKNIDKYYKINVGIYNASDEKIFHLSNSDSSKNIYQTKSYSECEIKKNPLMPGHYYTNIVVSFDGKEEVHRKCLRFNVINGDFYKVDRLPKLYKSKVFVDQNWIEK